MDDDLFKTLTPIGEQPPSIASALLIEIGETIAGEKLAAVETTRSGAFQRRRLSWPFQDRPWQHTNHVFGYVPPRTNGSEIIRYAGNLEPDESLRHESIKLTLDRLRIADYPGGSTHHILLHFYARNQATPTESEGAHYSALVRVREGDFASLISLPIFVGLNVGAEGLSFRCASVNLKNEADESLLSFMDSEVFKGGLTLLKIAQPALLPLANMTAGITKQIASRNRNVTVQNFEMGLDFSRIASRAQLAEGSYIVLQGPAPHEGSWDWSKWAYRPASGDIVRADDPSQMPQYNYLIFSVSRLK